MKRLFIKATKPMRDKEQRFQKRRMSFLQDLWGDSDSGGLSGSGGEIKSKGSNESASSSDESKVEKSRALLGASLEE